MWKIYHGVFQRFMNYTVKSNLTIEEKIQTLKTYCLDHFQELKWLLVTCFEDTVLNEDQYYFLTFTVDDGPITMADPNEFVISLLAYADGTFQIEIDIFNFQSQPLQYHLCLDGDALRSEIFDMETDLSSEEEDGFSQLAWIKPV